MTDPQPNLHSGFGRTLRALADKESDAEKKRLLEAVASQLEVAFDDAGNTAAIALWRTTEQLLEHQGDTNLMISALAEAVAAGRSETQEMMRQIQTQFEAYMQQLPPLERARLIALIEAHEVRIARIETHLGLDDAGG